MDADRCYLRDRLTDVLSSDRSYAIKRVTVYVPARIVSQNSTILDMPDTNDEDPINKQMTMDGIEDADILLVLPQLGRTLTSDGATLRMLADTTFINSVLFDADRPGRLAVLHYSERHSHVTARRMLDDNSISSQAQYEKEDKTARSGK